MCHVSILISGELITFLAGLAETPQLVLCSIQELSVSVRGIPSLALDSESLLKGAFQHVDGLPLLLHPVELM